MVSSDHWPHCLDYNLRAVLPYLVGRAAGVPRAEQGSHVHAVSWLGLSPAQDVTSLLMSPQGSGLCSGHLPISRTGQSGLSCRVPPLSPSALPSAPMISGHNRTAQTGMRRAHVSLGSFCSKRYFRDYFQNENFAERIPWIMCFMVVLGRGGAYSFCWEHILQS